MAVTENLPSPSQERPIGFGRLKRKEDARFIRGQGTYLDDIRLPGMVHGAMLRSPYAHAKIVSIDTSAALAHPGVAAVVTAKDLETLGLAWMPTISYDTQAVLGTLPVGVRRLGSWRHPSGRASSRAIEDAVAIGVGGMVGGGIFAVLGLSVQITKGAAPLAFLLAGLVALLTARSYALLSKAYPSRGGNFGLAMDLVSEVRQLDRRIAKAANDIQMAVSASGATLTKLHGLGVLTAGKILGRVGDVRT